MVQLRRQGVKRLHSAIDIKKYKEPSPAIDRSPESSDPEDDRPNTKLHKTPRSVPGRAKKSSWQVLSEQEKVDAESSGPHKKRRLTDESEDDSVHVFSNCSAKVKTVYSRVTPRKSQSPTTNLHIGSTGSSKASSSRAKSKTGFRAPRDVQLPEELAPKFIAPRQIAAHESAMHSASSNPSLTNLQIESSDIADDSNFSSPLTSPPGTPELDSFVFSTSAMCPMCHIHVDPAFLEEFRDGAALRWKDKLAFCKAHKTASATAQYNENAYPCIDWSVLESRLAGFDGQLDSVIAGTQPSFYRNTLEDTFATGSRSRNALRNPAVAGQETTVPGYYGLRGAEVMARHITSAFAGRIRRLAARDSLIPRIGVAGFVQAVLVPELAVLLVKEDLKLTEEEARVVLQESAELGKLVHAEEEQVVDSEDEE